jgi:hypothetical protein
MVGIDEPINKYTCDSPFTHEIRPDGIQLYKYKGKLHRIGGPAVIYPSGEYSYYKNGLVHREDGPAEYIIDNGFKCYIWCINGKFHRENGPSNIYVDDDGLIKESYWIDGEYISDGRPKIITYDNTHTWYRMVYTDGTVETIRSLPITH